MERRQANGGCRQVNQDGNRPGEHRDRSRCPGDACRVFETYTLECIARPRFPRGRILQDLPVIRLDRVLTAGHPVVPFEVEKRILVDESQTRIPLSIAEHVHLGNKSRLDQLVHNVDQCRSGQLKTAGVEDERRRYSESFFLAFFTDNSFLTSLSKSLTNFLSCSIRYSP